VCVPFAVHLQVARMSIVRRLLPAPITTRHLELNDARGLAQMAQQRCTNWAASASRRRLERRSNSSMARCRFAAHPFLSAAVGSSSATGMMS
jgi:hypothetical protein